MLYRLNPVALANLKMLQGTYGLFSQGVVLDALAADGEGGCGDVEARFLLVNGGEVDAEMVEAVLMSNVLWFLAPDGPLFVESEPRAAELPPSSEVPMGTLQDLADLVDGDDDEPDAEFERDWARAFELIETEDETTLAVLVDYILAECDDEAELVERWTKARGVFADDLVA